MASGYRGTYPSIDDSNHVVQLIRLSKVNYVSKYFSYISNWKPRGKPVQLSRMKEEQAHKLFPDK